VSDSTVDRLLLRDRWIVGCCVALMAALAWVWLWRESQAMAPDESMPGMEMPGAGMVSPSDAAAYLASGFVMWFLMMVAMMLPSAAPMIVFYGRLARANRAKGAVLAPTSIFLAMYLAVWAGFSALATVAQWLLVRSGVVSEMTLAFGNQRIGGCLLIAAGLCQATPLKRACLDACRSPMSFLMRFWRPGWVGAARLGLLHGMTCLGCCAALMALLFVFGVMNLVWIAALALIVLAEKVFPIGPRIGAAVGAVSVIVGLVLVLGVQLSGKTAG
jgi:predicted metal-binding membrane protein